jgi:hypothetical protein
MLREDRFDPGPGGGVWPYTSLGDWCGEHPDFPAWVASRPTPPAPPAA